MTKISDKSQQILDYRVANKHLTVKAVATKFGVKKQWVYILCKRAGVQSAADKYEGSILYVRNVPVDIVQSVKEGAKTEGITMRMKIIQLLENYKKSINNTKV